LASVSGQRDARLTATDFEYGVWITAKHRLGKPPGTGAQRGTTRPSAGRV